MAYQKNKNSDGVHTQIEMAFQIEKSMNDIRYLSMVKHREDSKPAYLNSIQHLFLTCNVYLMDDPQFVNEVGEYENSLNNYQNSIPNLDSRNKFKTEIKEMKFAEFIYPAILRALDRQHMLPRRTGIAMI